MATLGSIRIEPGLSDDEIACAEVELGFSFAEDHRALLASGLPVGTGWPNWRTPDGRRSALRHLRSPVEGILFAVEWTSFWDDRWGRRPAQMKHALRSAAYHLARVPQMVPVHAHCYLPAGHGSSGHPVLSIYQAAISIAGAELRDYVECGILGATPAPEPAVSTVDFWSDHVR
ncbi:hypothetical protein KXD98_08735 [Mycobacterium sp. SMC-4]|nr:hypothetical protein KXD98_08735 [Mycobacterium sp. SMC-4]